MRNFTRIPQYRFDGWIMCVRESEINIKRTKTKMNVPIGYNMKSAYNRYNRNTNIRIDSVIGNWQMHIRSFIHSFNSNDLLWNIHNELRARVHKLKNIWLVMRCIQSFTVAVLTLQFARTSMVLTLIPILVTLLRCWWYLSEKQILYVYQCLMPIDSLLRATLIYKSHTVLQRTSSAFFNRCKGTKFSMNSGWPKQIFRLSVVNFKVCTCATIYDHYI